MKTIGIVGGGQLGRMLIQAGKSIGLSSVVLDPTAGGPAGQVADTHIIGNFTDRDAVLNLAQHCDVMTFEIESANADALHMLEQSGFPVHPTPKTLSIIKDKFAQKNFLRARDIPVADFSEVASLDDARKAGEVFGYPFILKARSGGYDGRGNATIQNVDAIPEAFKKLSGVSLYAERMVPFERELAVVAVRTRDGEVAVYPLVETIHKNHICHITLAPAPVPQEVARKAHAIAERVLASFDGAGVFAIEMFEHDGSVLVNEIAPRVHNSGHWTIEGCVTSQFEQHMRAVAGLPLGPVDLRAKAVVMINILGERNGPVRPEGIATAEALGGVAVHIYGKAETKVERKMGHITVVGDTLNEARAKAEQARALITI